MRLDKYISECENLSRKEIKEAVKKGRVYIGNAAALDCSMHIDPESAEVFLSGKKLTYTPFVYLMLNKPAGVVSATTDKRFKTVTSLVPFEYSRYNLFPAGRLDRDTEGFLLLTNDGQLAHNLLSPRKHVNKTYCAVLDKPVMKEDIARFKKGIVLDTGYKTKPALLDESVENPEYIKDFSLEENLFSCSVTISEGKFHQIKKMFAALDKKVIYLKRVSFAGLPLDLRLKPGELRELTHIEIKLIKGG